MSVKKISHCVVAEHASMNKVPIDVSVLMALKSPQMAQNVMVCFNFLSQILFCTFNIGVHYYHHISVQL